MTGRAAYKQADLERAIRALKAAGEHIAGVEHTPHGFRVLTGEAQSSPQPANEPSPLERWEAENGLGAS